MLPRMVQHRLGPPYRNGPLGRQRPRQRERPRQRRLLGPQHLGHEADAQRLGGREGPRAQAHLLHPAEVADDLGQPGQGAEVGGDADVDFFDAEAGGGGAEADVGAGGDVDGDAVGEAVEDEDGGWGRGGWVFLLRVLDGMGCLGGGGSFVTNVMANQSLRVEGLRRGPRVRR